MLEKTVESPLDCKEIKSVNPKGNQSWIFIGSTDAEAETPILWPPDVKNWLMGKDPDAAKIEGRRRGDDRGWDGWMASLTWWTWVWASSGSWWWTGKLGMLQSMGSQRVGHKAETLILWPPHAKSWLIGKDSDAGRDWGQGKKGTTEDEMAGRHHQLNGHEFGWTPGVGDGQGGLACCNSWGRRESETTERLNWTELKWATELNWGLKGIVGNEKWLLMRIEFGGMMKCLKLIVVIAAHLHDYSKNCGII